MSGEGACSDNDALICTGYRQGRVAAQLRRGGCAGGDVFNPGVTSTKTFAATRLRVPEVSGEPD